MDDTFSEALIHRPGGHTVLGRRLRPLSYWHEALLKAFDNPFAYWQPKFREFIGILFDGQFRDFNFGALYQAAEICRCRHPEIPASISSVGEAFSFPRRTGRRLLEFRYRRHFPEELRKFAAYLQDYRSRPVFGTGKDSKPVSLPRHLYEVALLRRFDPKLSESDAWNSEASYSSWWTAAMAQAHGSDVKILTPAMRAALSEAGYEV